MQDSSLLVVILLNLATGIGLVALYTVLRSRDVRAAQQAQRAWERSLRETVELSEQMYKVLSQEIQELRQEIDGLNTPTIIHTSNGNLDKRFHVLSLAARGLSLEEITEKVDVPKGEAELILRMDRLKTER